MQSLQPLLASTSTTAASWWAGRILAQGAHQSFLRPLPLPSLVSRSVRVAEGAFYTRQYQQRHSLLTSVPLLPGNLPSRLRVRDNPVARAAIATLPSLSFHASGNSCRCYWRSARNFGFLSSRILTASGADFLPVKRPEKNRSRQVLHGQPKPVECESNPYYSRSESLSGESLSSICNRGHIHSLTDKSASSLSSSPSSFPIRSSGGVGGTARVQRPLQETQSSRPIVTMATENPFKHLLKKLPKEDGGVHGKYYSLKELNDPRVERLPYSIKVLLESAIRNCDNFQVTEKDVENIIDWERTSPQQVEIPFKPARVILQDFTGVPAVVDLAAMRDAMERLGGDPVKINPQVPVDLVIDHSVQVDVAKQPNALQKNMEFEFQRNKERFAFLKWGAKAFSNMLVVPPGSGIVHQVNLEYLARVVFNQNGVLFPDSLVGTDSHTTMIDGLGVAGWGVGGIEAEAAMLGQPMSMVLPGVVGFKLSGKLKTGVTATDLVLTCTQMLRKHGVVGKFVEFYGDGVEQLSLADRATIANMSPEYGATMGFFPVDQNTLQYLNLTGRDKAQVQMIEAYLRANGMFVDYSEPAEEKVFSSVLDLDLASVEPCVAGPKRPHDRVALREMKADWQACLNNRVGFKGFAIPPANQGKVAKFVYDGKPAELRHGDLVIAAITSCTNTSNPSVMLGAGLVARKALQLGLQVKPHIKTSLAPGSGVVTQYLKRSGLLTDLEKQGFGLVGYGCTTCIGNSGDLHESVSNAISANDIVAAAVLSGNRNFEGRVHPLTRANYLASPPLVVAYALAGTVNIDFEKQPIGTGKKGPVFLRDIWPSNEEVAKVVEKSVLPDMFKETYKVITKGNTMWNDLPAPTGALYSWDESSTYIHEPPFFKTMTKELPTMSGISDAHVLLNVGDSITTDHISPAGNIHKDSAAAKFLTDRGVDRKDFNSYGSRRGNDQVMARGTFANIRIVNKLLKGEVGPSTIHIPSGKKMLVYDAAMKYQEEGRDLIILAGAEYGSGSSRDWAAKGVYLQGVKAVIAKSFERIHRSNLAGMGVIPLCFKAGQDAETLGLTGHELFTIDLPKEIKPGMDIEVKVNNGRRFMCTLRFDTQVELTYFENGGILHFVLRQLLGSQ